MSVEPVEADEEETFCAVVPEKHAFTLAGGIYTSNCGACEPECPVEAIFPEDALPEKWEPFVKINYAFPDADVDQQAHRRVRARSTTSRTSRSPRRRMELDRLDHVALWVADRDAIADFAVAHLGMHEIERTDRFTLIGSNARRGKLTLFAEEPTREAGALAEIGLRVSSLEQALAALPEGHGERFEICDGLWIRLVEAETDVDYDLHHVALTTGDPAAAADVWEALGLNRARGGADGGRGCVSRALAG